MPVEKMKIRKLIEVLRSHDTAAWCLRQIDGAAHEVRLRSDIPGVAEIAALALKRVISLSAKVAKKVDCVSFADFSNGKYHVPTISLTAYLERMLTYVPGDPLIFVIMALWIIDRFTQDHNFPLTYYNVHRLLLTSVSVAAKVADDRFACPTANKFFGQVGGVTSQELSGFELELLLALNFNVAVPDEDFIIYCQALQSLQKQIYRMSRRRGNHKLAAERPRRDQAQKESIAIPPPRRVASFG